MLARTAKEQLLLAIVVIVIHVIVVSVVIFSGHNIPQFVSMWYRIEGQRLATGSQVNVIIFGRTSVRWMSLLDRLRESVDKDIIDVGTYTLTDHFSYRWLLTDIPYYNLPSSTINVFCPITFTRLPSS